MLWRKTGATHYHTQLGFQDKGRAMLCSMARVNDLWDKSMEKMKTNRTIPFFTETQ